MSHSVLETILESKVIAIVRGIPSGQISDLASAVVRGQITGGQGIDVDAPGGPAVGQGFGQLCQPALG